MKKLIPMVVLAGLMSFMNCAMADIKIGYVQADKILQNAPQTMEIGKKLEKEFNVRKTELERLQKQIQDQQAALDKSGYTASEAERTRQSRNIADLKLEFDRKKREFNEDINIRKNEELAALQDRVNKAIQSIAASGGYDMILFSGVAYASKQIDITDSVLKALSK